MIIENGSIVKSSFNMSFFVLSCFHEEIKTDRTENPRIHINQLESYRLAVSKFKSTETSNIKCYLFYLRSGNSVEI